MITLTDRQTIGSCDVYRDDVNVLLYYVMPHVPQIALDEHGKPIFSLVWYRRALDTLTEEERRTRLGGGILTLSAELVASDDEIAGIKATLVRQPRLQQVLQRRYNGDERKLLDAIQIAPVPVKGGTVDIAVLGEAEGSTGEFVSNLVGVGRVSMLGRQRASFMAKLTQDGAVLLWEMVERNLAAIRIGYQLQFEHRLDAVRMVVWCEARKSFEAIQQQWQDLKDKASFSDKKKGGTRRLSFSRSESYSAREILGITSEASQTSGVIVTPETAISTEHQMELERAGHDMIDKFLAATFLSWNPGEGFQPNEMPTLETELAEYEGRKYGSHDISYYQLKNWSEEMSASLRHTFQSKSVVEGHLEPNDNLSNILKGRSAADFRTQVDLDADWYKYLNVEVLCTADFDEDPVDLVKAHLVYEETGPQGRVKETGDFAFRKDSAPGRFLTFLADPAKRAYRYEYEVFYRGSSLTMKKSGRTEEGILVLDTDRLGVLHVDLEVGLIDWDRIKAVLVKTWYGNGADRREAEFTLAADRPSARWSAVIAREVDQPYHYQATFVDQNNQRIAQEPASSRSKTLILSQPLQDSLDVTLVPAGEFGEGALSQVVVALRYRDDANDYSANDSFILAKKDQSFSWKVPLVNKNHREYEYQVTVFYHDGVTREEPWRKSDQPVLAVGDPYGFRVQITPYLLKNPPYAFGTVHLTFVDAETNVRAARTLEIRDFETALYWRFRLGAPDRHTFRYQLTLFTVDGEEVTLPEAEESREVLVLRPPS